MGLGVYVSFFIPVVWQVNANSNLSFFLREAVKILKTLRQSGGAIESVRGVAGGDISKRGLPGNIGDRRNFTPIEKVARSFQIKHCTAGS